jgi:hypothetical protein
MAGRGTTGFSDCTFVQWDRKKEGRAALQAESGTVLVRGCEFREDKPQVRLGASVSRAIITENLFTGKSRVENEVGANATIANNNNGGQ